MKRPISVVEHDLRELRQEILSASLNKGNSANATPSIVGHYPIISEKELLTVGSTMHQNSVALDNERFFKLRFNFICPREQRAHIISLKEQFDLTDAEIRNMESSKVIVCKKGKSTTVKADKILFYMGRMMIALLCLRFLPLLALFLFIEAPAIKATLGASCCLTIFGALTFICYNHSIRPIKSLQQRGIKLGETLIFNGVRFVH